MPNRRRGPRISASGPVEILFDDPLAIIVQAELQDTSERGCRISHGSKRVVAGLEVRLRHEGTIQRARVIWTHILRAQRVSGFLFL